MACEDLARKALEPCPFVRVPRSKLQEARDLLTEKIRGSNARSPNHNARLVIDELLDSTAYDAIGSGVKALDELGSADEWKTKREELQDWTGSAWLAGEPDDDLRPKLYGFLCGLIGWMHCAEDAARALSTHTAAGAGPGCICQGCNRTYTGDLIVPDDVWGRIKPAGKAEGAGLLCASCIVDRAVAAGIWTCARAVDGDAEAGPVRDATDAMIEAGLKVDMTNEVEVAFLHNVWHAMVAAHRAGAGPVGEAVAVRDWLLVAKAAGEHGVRYRTNRALEGFLSSILPALDRPVEEPGEVERITRERDEAQRFAQRSSELHRREMRRAETAEAALAETRERLEKAEAALSRVLSCGPAEDPMLSSSDSMGNYDDVFMDGVTQGEFGVANIARAYFGQERMPMRLHEIFDEGSSWNDRRIALEEGAIKSAKALLGHSRGAEKIGMESDGISLTIALTGDAQEAGR